ncbi:MAG: DUF554 domain-containing protein [Chloroflexi bacterium]|nr:DUF554 domain-containing protein [Chloroflexota bacterium]
MPIGILVSSSAVVIGGIIGGSLGQRLPFRYKEMLPKVFGLIALAISITLIIKVQTLQAVALSLIIGTIVGVALNIHDKVEVGVSKASVAITKRSNPIFDASDLDINVLTSVIVLFCASGSGIYGAMEEGFYGTSSTLLVKSILDFFTAIIFGSTFGYIIATISIPQFIIYMSLFLLSRLILPLTNPTMLADFSACGGLITLGAGMNIIGLTKIKMINLLPSLIIVMLISALWKTLLG